MQKFEEQIEIDYLIYKTNWTNAFVREAYAVSPSYLKSNAEKVAPHALPGLFLLISLPKNTEQGIEFFFETVSSFSCAFVDHLRPAVQLQKGDVRFSFANQQKVDIRAKALSYAYLNKRYKGWPTRYGYQQTFDKSGMLLQEYKRIKSNDGR